MKNQPLERQKAVSAAKAFFNETKQLPPTLNCWQKFHVCERQYQEKIFSTPEERLNTYASLYELVFSLKGTPDEVFKDDPHVSYFKQLKEKLACLKRL